MLRSIIKPLTEWYGKNHRILPWRENHDPYRVWVSEIMLQQTRVETVIPYFNRFLQEFPDFKSLASAPEEHLLKLWEGLGYYSRARNLQKAAKKILSDFDGKMPETKKELLTLPGIGEYTAGAILSIAFGQPEPAVDGNVLRVLSRILNSRNDIALPETKHDLAEKLKKVYPAGHTSEFTQSLMELGALICLPNTPPLCQECPLKNLCQACQNKTTGSIPVKTKAKERTIVKMTVLLLTAKGKIALKKRPQKGLLAGLFELPNFPGELSEKEIKNLFPGSEPVLQTPHKAVFTHIEWHMKACRIDLKEQIPGYFWASKEDVVRKYSLPSAFRPFLKKSAGKE